MCRFSKNIPKRIRRMLKFNRIQLSTSFMQKRSFLYWDTWYEMENIVKERECRPDGDGFNCVWFDTQGKNINYFVWFLFYSWLFCVNADIKYIMSKSLAMLHLALSCKCVNLLSEYLACEHLVYMCWAMEVMFNQISFVLRFLVFYS